MNNNYEKLKLWNEEFNIRDFFDENNERAKSSRNSAYALITSNQVVNILCNGNGDGNHYKAQNLVSTTIMNIDNNDDNYGKIAIFLMHSIEMILVNEFDQKMFTIIIPEKISIAQFELLSEYLKMVKIELADILENEALFHYHDDYPDTSDIDVILEFARKRVDLNYSQGNDNVIIGKTINDFVKKII